VLLAATVNEFQNAVERSRNSRTLVTPRLQRMGRYKMFHLQKLHVKTGG
jgi:hypothetical protein